MTDMRKVIRLARKHGWLVDRNSKNHLRFTSPRGEVVTADCTPSDHRGIRNTVARLRAHGLPVPHKGGHIPRERNRR